MQSPPKKLPIVLILAAVAFLTLLPVCVCGSLAAFWYLKSDAKPEPEPIARVAPQASLRMSGIHKPSDGNFGIIVPAADRSDIDLFKDNPVEANAKWKGKVVEVEMNAFELRVVANEDGSTAALETPPGPVWGHKHGWQLAFFIFRGAKKDQLIGFQNREGVVVIRGRCEGLDNRFVTFEDCEIVKTP